MSLQIPPEFRGLWSHPGVRKAFINDPITATGNNCSNCGGAGIMWTFIATEGPYQNASTDLSKASHFHDGAWWIGSSHTAKCPVCKGNGAHHA